MIREKRERLINIFRRVQEIPYYCLNERDPDLLLKRNKGSCSEKHLFLDRELEKIGIPVKYLLIRFNWNDLPIPKEIIRKKDSPEGYHLALKIKIAGRWIVLDATWDPGLAKSGFPVTKDWNGRGDTKLAMKPLEIIELPERPPEQAKRPENREFYDALNNFLEKQRKL